MDIVYNAASRANDDLPSKKRCWRTMTALELSLSKFLVSSWSPCLHLALPSAKDLPPAPGSSVPALPPKPDYFTDPGFPINPKNPGQVVAVSQATRTPLTPAIA